jgi:hypothetical protein
MTTTDRLQGQGIFMSNSWDPAIYRQRAEEWRKRANSFGEGHDRTACLTIADGYDKLADLVESRNRQGQSLAPKPPER